MDSSRHVFKLAFFLSKHLSSSNWCVFRQGQRSVESLTDSHNQDETVGATVPTPLSLLHGSTP